MNAPKAAALGDVFGHRDGSVWRVVAVKPITLKRALDDRSEEVRRPMGITFARDYFFIHADKRRAS